MISWLRDYSGNVIGSITHYESQPATRYKLAFVEPEMWIDVKPRARVFAWCCKKLRYAQNCVAQSSYAGTMFFCADACGCKGKRELDAKARRAFRNRSAGQRRRYAKAVRS